MIFITHLGWTLVYPTVEDKEWKRQEIRKRLYDRYMEKLNDLSESKTKGSQVGG